VLKARRPGLFPSPAFRVFASKIVLERAVAAAEQPQMAPPAIAGVLSEHGRIRGGGDGEVEALCEMVGDAVVAVDPHRAHRAGRRLPLSIHQVIDHDRPVRTGEQVSQADRRDRRIAGVEIRRAFLEEIVLDDRSRRKTAAHRGDPLSLSHQLDLREAELFASGHVLG